MEDQFRHYIITLYQEIPTDVYLILLSLFISGSIFFMIKKGIGEGWKYASDLFLIEYIFILFGSTIIFRNASVSISGHSFRPFWSYEAILNGREDLIVENVMNTVVFIPVGLLLGLTLRRISWKQVLSIGCGMSAVIELLQLALNRGFCEVDDVMHNTAGCLIGYGAYRIVYKLGQHLVIS